jgi:hypothetical protein
MTARAQRPKRPDAGMAFETALAETVGSDSKRTAN